MFQVSGMHLPWLPCVCREAGRTPHLGSHGFAKIALREITESLQRNFTEVAQKSGKNKPWVKFVGVFENLRERVLPIVDVTFRGGEDFPSFRRN